MQTELLTKVVKLRAIAEDYKKSLHDLESDIEEAENQLIAAMEEESLTSFKIEGLGSVLLKKPKLYANYKKEFEDQVFAFLSECDRKDLIKPAVSRQSLSLFVADLVAEGKAVPEYISIFMKPSLSISVAASQGGLK